MEAVTFEQHLAALDAAGQRMGDLAVDAGMAAPVPTCPAWTVDQLLAHQTMVHRWATAHVRGESPEALPNQTQIRANVADLPAYFREGHRLLLAALRAAPPDLEAMTFLNDPPPPRDFWARRQAHETTMHMVDALGAALGRVPTTDEADVGPSLAEDGIDELLVGFFTRGKSKLFDGTEYDVLVAPTDGDRRWLLHVGPRLAVEVLDGGDAPAVPVVITGTASATYLALWNRGDDIEVDGPGDLLARWRATQRIGWS
jgi:uncharacterized protein (TIGR03083 family)